ncbi:MAG: WbqC family protein [Saprospiraceae bacterium]
MKKLPETADFALLEIQYLPPVQYFSLLANHPVVYLEQHEHYAKGSYRNRCHIAAVNGVQRLSIPLKKGKNQRQPIREVRIAYDEPWRSQHWQAIQTAYGNSPFFEHYADGLQPFYSEKKYEYLWDWDFDLLMFMVKCFRLQTEIRVTEKYEAQPAGLLDLRGTINPKIENADFRPVYYPQVFEDRHGFLGNLSALDLLFCAGPGARQVLSKSS